MLPLAFSPVRLRQSSQNRRASTVAFSARAYRLGRFPVIPTGPSSGPVSPTLLVFNAGEQDAFLRTTVSRWQEQAKARGQASQLKTLQRALCEPKVAQRVFALALPTQEEASRSFRGRFLGMAVLSPWADKTSKRGNHKHDERIPTHYLDVIQAHPKQMTGSPVRSLRGVGRALFYGLNEVLNREAPNSQLVFLPTFINPDNFFSRVLGRTPYQQNPLTSMVTVNTADVLQEALRLSPVGEPITSTSMAGEGRENPAGPQARITPRGMAW